MSAICRPWARLRAWVGGVSGGVCHSPGTIHHVLLHWLLTQGESAAAAVGRDGYRAAGLIAGHYQADGSEASRASGERYPGW